MNQMNEYVIKDSSANPAPLGLLGFGLTTVLLNIHNAMGIFYGGIAQIVAGIMESKKNNTFGFTAFVSYGFFWLSLVAVWVLPKLGWAAPASEISMAYYLGIWGALTFCFFIGTFKLNRALQIVFAFTTILFFMLAIGDATGNADIKRFAGYEGILCGASAIYTGIANLLNEVYGRTVMPIGPVK